MPQKSNTTTYVNAPKNQEKEEEALCVNDAKVV
jgi:hypothetical protein